MKRVVVTGIGALTPIGNDVRGYLDGLQKGISGANLITHFDAANFKTQFACEIKESDFSNVIDVRESRRLDNFSIYAMVAADEAFKASGLDVEQLNLDRCGVIWGSGIGGLRALEKEIEEFDAGNGIPRYNPFMIPKMISNLAAGHLSIKYGFRGPSYATVSACASPSAARSSASATGSPGYADCHRCGSTS